MAFPPLIIALGVGGLAYLMRKRTVPTTQGAPINVTPAPDMPPSLLSKVVAAVRSDDPTKMRIVANMLRAAGFDAQADDLDRSADEIERSQTPGATPANPIPVETAPPGSKEERQQPPASKSPGFPPLVQLPPQQGVPIVVQEPPRDAQPLPVPSEEERRIPPGTEKFVADYARMIYASAPRGPVIDIPMSTQFKKSTDVRGKGQFYGQGPALALIKRGVVPPTPWDWQAANPEQDKASYRRQLLQAKRDDPDRADLWDLAIADIV